MVSGNQIRLNRILRKGRMLCIPMYHGISNGPIEGLEDPASTIYKCEGHGLTSVIINKGILKTLPKPTKIGILVHFSSSTVLSLSPNRKMLTGTVTLYKQRFLHLEVDVALSSDPNAGTNSPRGFWSKIMPLIGGRKTMHEIDQSRRVREGRLQYFDHPNFGVIAAVTEIIDEEEELPPDTGTL